MNVKKAKALRKLAGHHSTDERKYESLKIWSAMGGGVREVKRTRVNSETSTRGIYRDMKRTTNGS